MKTRTDAFNLEIDKRMSSDEWGTMIAGKVLHHRKKRLIAAVGSLSAVAASVAIAVTFSITRVPYDSEIESLIVQQLNGGSSSVYASKTGAGDFIDDAIDEIIASR